MYPDAYHRGRVGPQPRRRRPKGRAGPRLRVLSAVTAGLSCAGTFALLTHGGATLRDADQLMTSLDRIIVMAGFGLENVQVTGHRYTSDADVFQALELNRSGSQLSFDRAAAVGRIERIGWVKSASIKRVLPDGLAIIIVERTPFAVWREAGRHVLVDDSGRELAQVAASDLGLPVLSGHGAGGRAGDIAALLAQVPGIRSRIIEAHLVAERRWTLVLAGGPRVMLPADGAAQALNRVIGKAPGLLEDAGLEAIDLRAPGRLVVRKLEAKSGRGRQDKPEDTAFALPAGSGRPIPR